MQTVYLTAPPESADELAAGLVRERLAACVNRVPCQSTYWWDDEIQTDDEVILLAKTTADRFPDLVAYVEREHPHDVPCIERFDAAAVLPAFADWVVAETES